MGAVQMHVHAESVARNGQSALAKETPRVIQSLSLEREGKIMRQDELVAAHVRALINSGELQPGDKLPTQAEIAESLGVNRNSVFWGLAALRSEGVIIGVRGGRAVVAKRGEAEASGDAEVTEEL